MDERNPFRPEQTNENRGTSEDVQRTFSEKIQLAAAVLFFSAAPAWLLAKDPQIKAIGERAAASSFAVIIGMRLGKELIKSAREKFKE